MTWRDLDASARRKTLIFVGVVCASLVWLFLPAGKSLLRRASAQSQFRQTPNPGARFVPMAQPAAPAPAPPIAAPASIVPPDPVHMMLGKWHGGAALPGRGALCELGLELRENDDKQGFSGLSTLSCRYVPTFSNGGDHIVTAEDRVKADLMSKGIFNPTSAIFEGTAQDGAIVLRAVQNIGVRDAVQHCEMVSLIARPFGANLAVTWQESGAPVCQGGDIVMVR